MTIYHITKKYKINDLVAFYKKVYPDSSFIHIENYEKINLLFQNFYNPEFDTEKEFNNMGLQDKDILIFEAMTMALNFQQELLVSKVLQDSQVPLMELNLLPLF